VVLDTGIADARKKQLPKLLNSQPHLRKAARVDFDQPDLNKDGYLDPVSGHGTFIAGLVQLLAPGQDLRVHRVLTSFGDGNVAGIIARLNRLVASGTLDAHSIVNLSFGGYADNDMALLARAIRRARHCTSAVFVASAGNDGIDRATYPACLPGVVSVGALDQYGPAPYTNYGSWVRACAPGTDLVSAFYHHYNGAMPVPRVPGGSDPDLFDSWARWTGTSFAAPIVVAALVRHMALHQCTAEEAVDAVVDGPGLFRLPWLGTVINLVPPVPS
jgi:subtilisin family serine protease